MDTHFRQADDGENHAVPMGIPAIAKMAFDGVDLAPTWNTLVGRLDSFPGDAASLMDLSTIAHIQGRPHDRLSLQARALELKQIYRQPPAIDTNDHIRLLAFMAPGDFMANMPIEFLCSESNVTLDMVYVGCGLSLPTSVPEHDIAMVAVAESDQNQTVLQDVAALVCNWPQPVLNAPSRIARLSREGTWSLLKSAPGVTIPIAVRIDRMKLERIAAGHDHVEAVIEGNTFPIIARPLDSHAGRGLSKLNDRAAISEYLGEQPEPEFCISPFVDYAGPDGLFRKYRVVLIDGRPYACHMAISEHWMIHYLNADMRLNAERRAEEARFMAAFDGEFAVRHQHALQTIAACVGLDYVPIDCAETRDGQLLVFEVGTNMIVHSMDPPDLFPYKRKQMNRIFAAFYALLKKHAPRAA